MSGINALPAAWQKVQFDAITGMKSPPASIKPSFQPENTASLLSCQHGTPPRDHDGQKITLSQFQDVPVS